MKEEKGNEAGVKSSRIIGGAGSFDRHKSDFYATPKEATVAALKFIELRNGLNSHIIEPACGEGHISLVLKEFGYNKVSSYDIRHTGFGEGGIDYLSKKMEADFIITNPPFNLAEEFIRKAVQEAPVVAMLLKAQYWHSKGRYKMFLETKPKYILPLTWRPAMAPDRGTAPTMDFQWTVWDSSSENKCTYFLLKKP